MVTSSVKDEAVACYSDYSVFDTMNGFIMVMSPWGTVSTHDYHYTNDIRLKLVQNGKKKGKQILGQCSTNTAEWYVYAHLVPNFCSVFN